MLFVFGAGMLGAVCAFFGFFLCESYIATGRFALRIQARDRRAYLFAVLTGLLCGCMANFSDISFSVPITLLLCMLSWIDFRCGLLPNELILALLLLALLRATALNIWESSLYGLLLGGGFFALCYMLGRFFLRREAMGLGDVKLMAACGFWLGWQSTLPALLIAPISAIVIVFILWIFRRFSRDTAFPFGPFIALASIFCQMFGENLLTLWRAAFGL